MATVPSPRTWAVGDVVSAARLNTEISTAINYLLNPPACDVYCTAGTSIPDGATFTQVLYDTEESDTDNMHSTASNTGRITFNTPGRYEIMIYSSLPGATYTVFSVNPRINSGGSATGGTSIRTFPFGTPGGSPYENIITLQRVFAAADYMEVFVAQTSGGARALISSGTRANGVSARWVGAS